MARAMILEHSSYDIISWLRHNDASIRSQSLVIIFILNVNEHIHVNRKILDMKTKKLWAIDVSKATGMNIGSFNPTCKAMIKALYQLSREESFVGISGDDLLKYCVEHNMWSTKQVEEKYMTTFAFYKKLLVEKAHMIEVGSVSEAGIEEILGDEDINQESEEKTEELAA